MEKITCAVCGKILEGYHSDHVKYLLEQHKLTHEKRYGKKK